MCCFWAITLFLSVSGAQLESSVERPCPGETLTFTCTVPSLAHQWIVPSLNISQPLTPSSQLNPVPPVPPFQFSVTEVRIGSSITSTATVTVTADLNGTLVMCQDGNLALPDNQNSTINLRGEHIVTVCLWGEHVVFACMYMYASELPCGAQGSWLGAGWCM